MMPRILLLVAGALLLTASPSWAQSKDPWWKLFEIRKSFDGGSAEQEPANAGLVDPGPDSTVYWLLGRYR